MQLKQHLRALLEIPEGPNCLDVIPMHVEMVAKSRKELLGENSSLKQKMDELTTRFDE